MLAPSYSRLATTIASEKLNCRVRNGNGCTLFDEAPTYNIRIYIPVFENEPILHSNEVIGWDGGNYAHSLRYATCMSSQGLHPNASPE